MYQGLVFCDIIVFWMACTQQCNIAVIIEYSVIIILSCLYVEKRVMVITAILSFFTMLLSLFCRLKGTFGRSVVGFELFQWYFPEALAYALAFIYVFMAAYFITIQFNKTINRSHNQSKQIYRMQNELILSLANIVEANDKYTGGHIKRTSKYVKLIANKLYEMGEYKNVLTPDYVETIVSAAPLHDVGKITVPNTILTKPGKYTDEEYEKMKTHALAGYDLIHKELANLENPEFIQIAGDMALYHHERWDGSGYPNGIKGEKIPLCGRIMAVADVLDALLSKRHYKEAFTLDDTFDIMLSLKDIQFEGRIVDAVILLKDEIIQVLND